ncbi:MAG: chlorite dismutase [Acidimicrobiales bacterium]
MTNPLPVAFVAGFEGAWRIDGITAPTGDALAPAARLAVVEGPEAEQADGRWVLRGTVDASHEPEAGGPPLGRPEARCAALVAVRLGDGWRALSRDERDRRVLAATDHPAVARRLHHAGGDQPFDLLAWFEYPPVDEDAVASLVAGLRATEDWSAVEREVDLRLVR